MLQFYKNKLNDFDKNKENYWKKKENGRHVGNKSVRVYIWYMYERARWRENGKRGFSGIM